MLVVPPRLRLSTAWSLPRQLLADIAPQTHAKSPSIRSSPAPTGAALLRKISADLLAAWPPSVPHHHGLRMSVPGTA
eukprot:3300848-Rhodomonas_salina.1